MRLQADVPEGEGNGAVGGGRVGHGPQALQVVGVVPLVVARRGNVASRQQAAAARLCREKQITRNVLFISHMHENTLFWN